MAHAHIVESVREEKKKEKCRSHSTPNIDTRQYSRQIETLFLNAAESATPPE